MDEFIEHFPFEGDNRFRHETGVFLRAKRNAEQKNKEQGIMREKAEDGMEKKFDLDERLILFAAVIIDVAEALPKTLAGNHLSGQLIRSGTAPALQYGEAQSAESRAGFIHKMKVAVKELRETYNCLRIIKLKNWLPGQRLDPAVDENNQLISIFVKSIATAQSNEKDVM